MAREVMMNKLFTHVFIYCCFLVLEYNRALLNKWHISCLKLCDLNKFVNNRWHRVSWMHNKPDQTSKTNSVKHLFCTQFDKQSPIIKISILLCYNCWTNKARPPISKNCFSMFIFRKIGVAHSQMLAVTIIKLNY